MSDNDPLADLEEKLTRHFRDHERVSPAAIETAQTLFSLRSIDDELAALQETLSVPARGSGQESLRFAAEDLEILLSVAPNQLMIIVAPAPDSAALESATGLAELDLDDAGGVTVDCSGVVRIRVRRSGHADVVTDALLVPSAADD